jgi:hypothetical protein
VSGLKLRSSILAFVWLLSAAAFAGAEPRAVSVPAGELIDAIDFLAKQYGVDVIYPSGSLRGQKTRGLNGTFEPMDAFKKLLDGTPLVLSEEGGALLITRAPRAVAATPAPAPPPPTAQGPRIPDAPITEVEIEASRPTSLLAMRAELLRLEAKFYDEYNSVNTEHQFDINCPLQERVASHVLVRSCQASAVRLDFMDEVPISDGGVSRSPVSPLTDHFAPAASRIRLQAPGLRSPKLRTPEFRRNVISVVTDHPELLELLKQRSALAERYEALRKQRLGGKAPGRD